MNINNIIKNVLGGLLICIITCIITSIILSNKYQEKVNFIKNNNQYKIDTLKQENDNMKSQINTYKYLYDTCDLDIKQYREKAIKAENKLQELKSKIYLSQEKTKNISRGNYRYNDLSNYEIMTVDEMNKWIKDRAPEDSPFIGKGEMFLKISAENNIDPKYIVAHAALESGWGKHSLGKSNYFGIGAFNDSPVKSALTFNPGLESGIEEGTSWIKENYYENGKTTLDKMINCSMPYAQNNDGSPNTKWINQIENIIYPS